MSWWLPMIARVHEWVLEKFRIQIWKILILPACNFFFFFCLEVFGITLNIPHDLYFFTCLLPLRVWFVSSYLSLVYRLCLETSFSRRNTPQVYRQGPKKKERKNRRKKKRKESKQNQQKKLLTKKKNSISNNHSPNNYYENKKISWNIYFYYSGIFCVPHFSCCISPTSRMVSIRETWPFLFFFFLFLVCVFLFCARL
jgi:hypothetical protein